MKIEKIGYREPEYNYNQETGINKEHIYKFSMSKPNSIKISTHGSPMANQYKY